jgi:antagonist of KipI
MVLQLASAGKGCRCYLGIRGNWKVPELLGSASVYQLGGFGKALQKGKRISIERKESKKAKPGLKSAEGKVYLPSSLKVRFIKGPEWNELNTAQQEDFQQFTYEVQSNSDRMGIRLKSKNTLNIEREAMISSPTATGCIQLTNSGQPVVLMRDGQTTGGYPRLGTVIRIDLNRIAQLRPGDQLRFRSISYEEAIGLFRAYRKNLSELFG